MKKIIIIILFTILMSGCSLKPDTMEGITIYVSSFPIEYITTILYGDNATVESIYPSGVNIFNYELTTNQINNFSKGSLYVYNGLMKKDDKNIEAQYASSMINKNKNLKIIDASKGMEYNSHIEELWLNPSNMLMMSNNIMSGLEEYIKNPYLIRSIQNNYSDLQITLSALDSDFKEMYENANTKTIVVSSDAFKFLEKYNFQVISIEENDFLTTKTVSDVKQLIASNKVKHIFVNDYEEESPTIKHLKDTTDVKIIVLNTITAITESQKENKEDYISIMKNNLQKLQTELYK